MKYELIFDPYGGYDCMSSAYIIKRDGKTIVVVDSASEGFPWYTMDGEHDPNPDAERIAKTILQALEQEND